MNYFGNLAVFFHFPTKVLSFQGYSRFTYNNQKYTYQMRLFQIKVLYLPSKDGILLSPLSKITA